MTRIAREWYRAAGELLRKIFLARVPIVAQWVHNGNMDSTHKQQGGTVNDLHRYYGSDPSYRESMPCSECGKVGGCEHFPSARDDHSASRNVDVLRHEAPHLLAQPDEPRPITTTEINDAITDAISWLIVAEREHPDCPGITATKHRLAALAGNVVPL